MKGNNWKRVVLLMLSVVLLKGTLSACERFMQETNPSDIAKIITDYEQETRDEVDKLCKENPGYHYYFPPVARVSCTYVLENGTSASNIIEKYDIYNLFAAAKIAMQDSAKTIRISFNRDDFTEGTYQKIKQVKDGEPLIKDLYISIEKAHSQSYMPKIEYHTENASALPYTLAEQSPQNLFEDKGFIIKSAEEYGAYLDCLLGAAEYPYVRDNIELLKNLYDASFFEENALIITKKITRGSGSIQMTVDNLYISDNKVYVVIKTDVPVVGTCDLQTASFTFCVQKSDIIDASEVITLE